MEEHKLTKLNIKICTTHFTKEYRPCTCPHIYHTCNLCNIASEARYVSYRAIQQYTLLHTFTIHGKTKIIANRTLTAISSIRAYDTIIHTSTTLP